MTICNFIKNNNLESMNQITRAKYLCFYAHKEYAMNVFKISDIQH